MNLVKTTDQYDDKGIFFCDPIKNNIMTIKQALKLKNKDDI